MRKSSKRGGTGVGEEGRTGGGVDEGEEQEEGRRNRRRRGEGKTG
jgi:hypothetical protein